ncbi:P-loop containing nucleoside triphosphate hydrolase protein [Pluteus cervinus]|uniref:P-loop containing nucleoside triphosphate hydrolase protein n=1 Tax=Pluteus cervinus TaxID=181527 RepID=A0ACD3BHL3_9AGAR|nr:P-loop containing nucleoside triphosphate hydrolase protein [Pluteus cervinus]
MPSFTEIRVKVHEVFGVKPCLWQVKVIQGILERKRDVVLVAGTGMGKTLTFLAPMVFRPKGSIQLIVAPLNLLGEQQVASLKKANLKGIFIGADTATYENFLAIEDGEYNCVIITPEQLVKEDGGFSRLCKKPGFQERLISVVFDEAHCVSTWADFRTGYKQAGLLRHTLGNIPFVAVSATMPQDIIKNVYEALEIREDDIILVRTSTDRPNIRLHVRDIKHTLDSYRDLEFVLGRWQQGNEKPKDPPEKFVVFFDEINESIRACVHMRKILATFGEEYRHKVVWFNSDMTDEFKREAVERFQNGELWGLFASEAFGLGMDLPDIRLVVQWRRVALLSTLWQRIGRGARNASLDATAVYLVEREYTDKNRQEQEEDKKEKERGENKKRKREDEEDRQDLPQPKRPRTSKDPAESQVLDPPTPSIESSKPFLDLGLLSDNDLLKRYASAEKPAPLGRRDATCVMDDFVNAGARRLGCRRRILNLYFGNSEASSDYIECSRQGCARCRAGMPAERQEVEDGGLGVADDEGMELDVAKPRICCDVCDGDNPFLAYAAPKHVESDKQPRKTPLTGKNPMPNKNVQKFADELEDLLEQQTLEAYDYGAFADIGSILVMPTNVFQRLILCIRHNKAPRSIDDLRRETQWDDVDSCGAHVVELINKHFPPQKPAPSSSATPTDDVLTIIMCNGVSSAPSQPRRCTRCRNTGHNVRTCPLPAPTGPHSVGTANGTKENLAPD